MVAVAKTVGLHGFVLPRLPLAVLRLFLTVRVTPILSIDLRKVDPKYEAGHLVVIAGYDKKDRAYIVHDPSSVIGKPGKFVHIHSEELRRISNNRGIIIF